MKFCIPLIMLILYLTTTNYADEVYSKTETANRLYKQGNYEEALKLYEDALLLSPSEDKLKINRGSALYHAGDLDGAEKSYQGALSAKETKTRATAHYNLGNILFRKGEAMQQQGDQKAQELYKGALDNYIKALDLQPTDYDAKWNLQLAHQRIKQLEQQQQQQKNDNKDNKQNKQDQQNKQNEKNKQDQQNKDNKQNNQDQQNKDNQQDKQDQGKDEKKEPDDKQKDETEQQKQESQSDSQKDQPQGEPQDRNKDDMKKEEARRIIELFADDADSLNKPVKKGIGKEKQPEKDW